MSKSMCFHVYDKTTTLSIPQPAEKKMQKKEQYTKHKRAFTLAHVQVFLFVNWGL